MGQEKAEGEVHQTELVLDLNCRARRTDTDLLTAGVRLLPLCRYGLASCTYPRDARRARWQRFGPKRTSWLVGSGTAT